jgi:hypothetical protein
MVISAIRHFGGELWIADGLGTEILYYRTSYHRHTALEAMHSQTFNEFNKKINAHVISNNIIMLFVPIFAIHKRCQIANYLVVSFQFNTTSEFKITGQFLLGIYLWQQLHLIDRYKELRQLSRLSNLAHRFVWWLYSCQVGPHQKWKWHIWDKTGMSTERKAILRCIFSPLWWYRSTHKNRIEEVVNNYLYFFAEI